MRTLPLVVAAGILLGADDPTAPPPPLPALPAALAAALAERPVPVEFAAAPDRWRALAGLWRRLDLQPLPGNAFLIDQQLPGLADLAAIAGVDPLALLQVEPDAPVAFGEAERLLVRALAVRIRYRRPPTFLLRRAMTPSRLHALEMAAAGLEPAVAALERLRADPAADPQLIAYGIEGVARRAWEQAAAQALLPVAGREPWRSQSEPARSLTARMLRQEPDASLFELDAVAARVEALTTPDQAPLRALMTRARADVALLLRWRPRLAAWIAEIER